MTPLQKMLYAITATREPQTTQRLTDVKNIGPDSAKEAAVRVAYWLALLDIANRLTNPHLRRVALEMLYTDNCRSAERFLWELVK